MALQQFDVFLAHSSKDKPLIRKIYLQLKERGIRPWLDEEEIAPGSSFQDEIQQAIGLVKTAAIFIGHEGLGQWQELELKTLISQCIARKIPVIPVLLPGVTKIPERLPFLMEFHAVSFNGENDFRAFGQLEWGITQIKPTYDVANVVSDTSLSNHLNVPSSSSLEILEGFLSSGKLKKADKQTKKIILEHNRDAPLTAPAIRELPLDLLASIDQLWRKYGDDKFGLVIQRQLWQQCLEPQKPRFNPFAQGVPVTDSQAWNELGYLVGWRDVDRRVLPDPKINFSVEAPSGCFPQTRRWLHGGYGNDVKQFKVLMERIAQIR